MFVARTDLVKVVSVERIAHDEFAQPNSKSTRPMGPAGSCKLRELESHGESSESR
jgi:hypothetical protein